MNSRKEYIKEWEKKNAIRIRIRKRAYNKSPQGKRVTKKIHLRRAFGISIEEYEAKLAQQNNKCAICDSPFDSNNKMKIACVDHNHTTNQIRDLLCHSCNTFIGFAKEDTAVLNKAIQYLHRHATLD